MVCFNINCSFFTNNMWCPPKIELLEMTNFELLLSIQNAPKSLWLISLNYLPIMLSKVTKQNRNTHRSLTQKLERVLICWLRKEVTLEIRRYTSCVTTGRTAGLSKSLISWHCTPLSKLNATTAEQRSTHSSFALELRILLLEWHKCDENGTDIGNLELTDLGGFFL